MGVSATECGVAPSCCQFHAVAIGAAAALIIGVDDDRARCGTLASSGALHIPMYMATFGLDHFPPGYAGVVPEPTDETPVDGPPPTTSDQLQRLA